MYYHIQEFFRIQPKGILYVGIFAEPSPYDGSEVETLQEFTNGEIKQASVYLPGETYASSHITSTQAIADILVGKNMDIQLFLHADMYGGSASSLSNASALNSRAITPVLGEEGNYLVAAYDPDKNYKVGDKCTLWGRVYKSKEEGTGYDPITSTNWTYIYENLREKNGFSISSIGNALGTTALANVHECIGWVGKFNQAEGDTLDEVGLATGEKWKDLSDSLKDELADKHYLFLTKEVGSTGTFYSDSRTAIEASNDYCTIENNRVWNKAKRLVRQYTLDYLKSPLRVNADGTLDALTIANIQGAAVNGLNNMQNKPADLAEVSAFSVTIDPTQNVLSTSRIDTAIKIVPVGVGRELVNTIGFALKV